MKKRREDPKAERDDESSSRDAISSGRLAEPSRAEFALSGTLSTSMSPSNSKRFSNFGAAA